MGLGHTEMENQHWALCMGFWLCVQLSQEGSGCSTPFPRTPALEQILAPLALWGGPQLSYSLTGLLQATRLPPWYTVPGGPWEGPWEGPWVPLTSKQ